MPYSSRFFLYAPITLLLALAAGVLLWWHLAAGTLEKRLDALNGHEIAPGVRISFASRRIEGFPFRLDAILDRVRLETSDSFGEIAWQSEQFASHSLTYGGDQILFEAAGRQKLTWHDKNKIRHDLPFAIAGLHASALLGHGNLSRFDLDILGFSSPALAAERIQFHLRKDPLADALDLYASLDDGKLSSSLASRFGDNLSRVLLDAKLREGSALEPLLDARSDWRVALDNWRRHQGRLSVSTFLIDLGRLHGAASGELGLDASRRPMGQITLHIADATKIGNAPPRAAIAEPGMGSALSDFALHRQGALEDRLDAPILFNDGRILVGPFPAGDSAPLY